ncbi:MAG: hypothetical protein AAFQ98_06375 [Bacteroidota bacterium]
MRLFGSKKPSLSSISLPDWGWEQKQKNKTMVQWVNPEAPVALSINFFAKEPDLPTTQDVEELRNYYRSQLTAQGGGILQVEIIKIQGIKAIKTLFKFPQQPSGTMYLGSYTLPFEKCSYVLKLQGMELEPTGQRESLVADAMIKQGKLVANEKGEYPGWAADPYAPEYQHTCLMNKSEAISYDLQFPDHPLSQVRTYLTKLSWDLKAEAILKEQPPFAK